MCLHIRKQNLHSKQTLGFYITLQFIAHHYQIEKTFVTFCSERESMNRYYRANLNFTPTQYLPSNKKSDICKKYNQMVTVTIN